MWSFVLNQYPLSPTACSIFHCFQFRHCRYQPGFQNYGGGVLIAKRVWMKCNMQSLVHSALTVHSLSQSGYLLWHQKVQLKGMCFPWPCSMYWNQYIDTCYTHTRTHIYILYIYYVLSFQSECETHEIFLKCQELLLFKNTQQSEILLVILENIFIIFGLAK